MTFFNSYLFNAFLCLKKNLVWGSSPKMTVDAIMFYRLILLLPRVYENFDGMRIRLRDELIPRRDDIVKLCIQNVCFPLDLRDCAYNKI